MNLSLEIVSSNGQSLGAGRRKVFGPEGGRIGRSAECDWVLANPYISRHHATIRWISGTYYIESTGENGVAIGTAQAMIPKLERRPIKHGDRIFIDEYEVVVGLDSVVGDPAGMSAPRATSGTSAGAFAPADDPFDLGPTRASRALVEPPESAPDDLDPLRHIGGSGASPVVTAPRQEPTWNHTPGVSDHFAAPPPARNAPSASVIPDDWDKTTFGRKQAPGAPPAPTASAAPPAVGRPAGPSAAAGMAAPPAAQGAGAIPDDWDKTNFSRKAAAAPSPAPRASPTPSSTPTPTPARAPAPGSPAAGARPAPQAGRVAAQPAAVSGAPAPAPARTAPGIGPTGRTAAVIPPGGRATGTSASVGAPAGSSQAGFDIDSLLRSAGVDPASLPPDTADSLGLILRSVVQGMIDVLRARSEIKEQFRLSHTIVKTAENNPLKFAVNAEDALNSLLGRRNPAYLPPVDAFEDAFNDIRFHQLAMLAGMRAGFDNVMSRFDPQQLQESFDKRAKRGGLLSMSGRSRYWEQFAEEFQELAGDREQAFRRLFAEEFAAAYEKQLELLKRSHSKMQR
jgi:type VI secretion system FHA domain protein